MRSVRILQTIAVILATLGLSAGTASAADLYLGLMAGFSNGTGDGTGTNDLQPGQKFSGEGEDSSPIYGGTLGIAVPLSDVIPWALRIPSFDIPVWPGKSWHIAGTEAFHFPGWSTQMEFEATTGRKFDFRTAGASPLTQYVGEVESTSFMGNFRLDIPIQAPMTALFGRLPMLEPVTIYAGGGVGTGWNELKATDSANSGSDTVFNLAYQFGAGMGYAMSDQLHLTIGWRYLDLGEMEVDLSGLQDGSYKTEFGSHEFTTALRFHFYHIPFFGRE